MHEEILQIKVDPQGDHNTNTETSIIKSLMSSIFTVTLVTLNRALDNHM